jgi:topoisomerase IA-like protein
VTVKKMIEPKILGIHKEETVYLCTGPYGEYLRYDKKNYSIPDFMKQNNLNEMFNLYHAVKIIDYKMNKQKQEVEKKLETKRDTFQNYKHAFVNDDSE